MRRPIVAAVLLLAFAHTAHATQMSGHDCHQSNLPYGPPGYTDYGIQEYYTTPDVYCPAMEYVKGTGWVSAILNYWLDNNASAQGQCSLMAVKGPNIVQTQTINLNTTGQPAQIVFSGFRNDNYDNLFIRCWGTYTLNIYGYTITSY